MPKKDIHPKFSKVMISCSTCHFEFESMSTLNKDFKIDTCSSCHPFYTGKQKFANTGRVEKFKSKVLKKDLFNKSAKKLVNKDNISKES